MSRRKLWILTIALSLALLGLIIVQLFWMKNAVDLKEKQFEQLVNNTLSDVSSELEQYYTSLRMKRVMEAENRIGPESKLQWNIQVEQRTPSVIRYRDRSDTSQILPPPEKESETMIELEEDSLITISVTDIVDADTIIISEVYTEDKLRQLEASVRAQEKLVKKVMKDMLLEDVSFGERIGQKDFNKILEHSLKDRGLTFPYEYTILENTDREVYSTEGFRKNTSNYIFRTSLMGEKLLENSTYLYLYFPEQKKYIRGSMGLLGSSTILFTVLMVITFSFALYVIFRQKKLSDIKSDFVSNMTHELKTPISTISLASQMLSDTSIPQEKKNMAQISRIIQTESKRLGYQVERVLQMAVLDQGHLVLKKRAVSMHDLISAVEHNFRLQIENMQGTLELNLEAGRDGVYGDRVHLTNVITNLVDNAVKYSQEKPQVSIRTYNVSGGFYLSVEDQGIGIRKEDQNKVFDKFFRVSTGNLHDVKGFGLGLSYVKLIVEQHGGDIGLTSEPGKGSKFDIRLPLHSETT